MTDSSTRGIKTVLHPVSDLATAKAVYTALLGVPPQTDESYYVGFEAAGQHIGLVPGDGPQGTTSPVAYWHVPDLEAKLAEVTAAGATVKEPAYDVDGGRRDGPRHRPRWQCPRAASGPMSADRCSRA
jgi:predicted enzyme related to lactoylglutathione lyase